GEMLSAASRQSVSITSAPEIPSRALVAPISFANAIFTAWNALQAYLMSSAARSETRHGATPSGEYNPATRPAAAASELPTTSSEGVMTSAMAVPSRRNAGFAATAAPGSTSAAQTPAMPVMRP